jgi:two-component system, chemotaxis family, protein-glutamate methylesterase/glutaminase
MEHPTFDIVVIGASLGGVEALKTVLGALPPDFPVPIAVVQHIGNRRSELAEVLRPHLALPVRWGCQDVRLERGTVDVAPSDCHMLVTPSGTVRLVRSGPVKFCRPAVDPLFVSAAAIYRERTLALVLTGCNTDGASGVQAVKWTGGMVLAQDPATARASGMPRAAIMTGCVDLVLPLEALGPALIAAVMAPGAGDFLRVPLRAA